MLSKSLNSKTYSHSYSHTNRLSDTVSKIIVLRGSDFDSRELHVIASNCVGAKIIQK